MFINTVFSTRKCQNTTSVRSDFIISRQGTIPVQNAYNIQVWCLAHRSEDHSVWVQQLEAYVWRQQCTRTSLGAQWIFPDTEPADTRRHSGIHLECVQETSMYRILCECTMAYNGVTGCSIKTGTTDSSVLNKSAITEHGINILLKDGGVLATK